MKTQQAAMRAEMELVRALWVTRAVMHAVMHADCDVGAVRADEFAGLGAALGFGAAGDAAASAQAAVRCRADDRRPDRGGRKVRSHRSDAWAVRSSAQRRSVWAQARGADSSARSEFAAVCRSVDVG